MSYFTDDCGEGIPRPERLSLESGWRRVFEHAVDKVGPCQRCKAEVLGILSAQLAAVVAAQPAEIRWSVEGWKHGADKRAQAIDAESRRIAQDLLRGAW